MTNERPCDATTQAGDDQIKDLAPTANSEGKVRSGDTTPRPRSVRIAYEQFVYAYMPEK